MTQQSLSTDDQARSCGAISTSALVYPPRSAKRLNDIEVNLLPEHYWLPDKVEANLVHTSHVQLARLAPPSMTRQRHLCYASHLCTFSRFPQV